MFVSVILPVYNSQSYIKRSISSILNQTYEKFELIIVDDGSTDNSVNIVKSFQDKRIKLFLNKHKGISNT